MDKARTTIIILVLSTITFSNVSTIIGTSMMSENTSMAKSVNARQIAKSFIWFILTCTEWRTLARISFQLR